MSGGGALMPQVRALPQDQRFAMRVGSFGILAVLLALAACAAWGAATTYRADVAVRRASEASQAIEQARRAVGAIRMVRRTAGANPGDEARSQHREATGALMGALQRARVFSDGANRRMVDELLNRTAAYVRASGPVLGDVAEESLPMRVFEPARGDLSRSESAYVAVESLMDTVAERLRTEALSLLGLLVAIQTRVFIGGPVFFALGLLLIGLIWRMQRGEQRRGTAQMVRDAFEAGAAERRFRGLVDHAPDLVLICAGPGTIAYNNLVAQTDWSYPEDALVGRSVLMIAHPDDQAALRAWWEQLRPVVGGSVVGGPVGGGQVGADIVVAVPPALEIRLRDADGDWRRVEMRGVNLLGDAVVKGIVLTIRDVGQRRAEEARAHEGALFDPLTTLPNGALLRDRLGQAMIRAGRRKDQVGVFSVGLAGVADDRVMADAVTRLLACVRPQDTVARLGVSQLVVVREGVETEADVLTVAESIAEQFVRRPGGTDEAVSIRIGVVLGDPRRDGSEELLRDATLAMQQVLAGSPVRYALFGVAVQSDTLDKVELEGDLVDAMHRRGRDSGAEPEFRIHFQPIVSLRSVDVRGVEALIRWQHPVHGMVPPRDFIPMAEETGLIVPLGQWVLEEACRRVVGWQREFRMDPPLTLSVNLSSLQFQQPGLVGDVSRALSLSGLAAGCLRLEITEGTIMRDPDVAVRTLWALKDLGVQLAIDDFGSGYSAISYLKQLPLGLLKIDGAFVSGIGTDAEDTSIVRAIMALSKSLGWGVTAEGIETADQAALLDGWGCDFGQGYHFARPFDVAGTTEYLRQAAAAQIGGAKVLHPVG